MEIKNNVIVSLDKKDKNLVVPKNAVGVEYPVSDICSVDGFESFVVEVGNEHFYVESGCLIWRDKKMIVAGLKDAKIPEDKNVEKIAAGAFMYQSDLQEIEIPKNIKTIGYNAFASTGLKKVELGEGLETLDLYAFGFNEEMQTLTIPKSVKKFITHKVLEEVSMLSEMGYKNKTYRVYKNTYAHRYMKKNGLQFEVIDK